MSKSLLGVFILVCFVMKFLIEHGTLDSKRRTPKDLKLVQASYHGQSLKKYSLGLDNLLAASIWVQLLQHAEHTPVPEGEVSWEFAQLDAITELDPKFERAYEFGSIFVSSFRQDKVGGKILLEKWVNRRPSYWRATYLLGVHHFLQMGNEEEAGRYILKASHMQRAPEWMSSLGVRLLSASGAFLQSLKIAVETLPQLTDAEAKYRMKKRIRSLNYNLQKQYLTEALSNYQEKYGRFPSQMRDLEPFLQAHRREIATAFANDEVEQETASLLTEKFQFMIDPKDKKIAPVLASLEEELGQHGVYVPKATAASKKSVKP